jgi:hypothetical protein
MPWSRASSLPRTTHPKVVTQKLSPATELPLLEFEFMGAEAPIPTRAFKSDSGCSSLGLLLTRLPACFQAWLTESLCRPCACRPSPSEFHHFRAPQSLSTLGAPTQGLGPLRDIILVRPLTKPEGPCPRNFPSSASFRSRAFSAPQRFTPHQNWRAFSLTRHV